MRKGVYVVESAVGIGEENNYINHMTPNRELEMLMALNNNSKLKKI